MRRIQIMLAMLLISSQLLAQNRTVTGTITDSTGQPLVQVSVVVTGTRIGTFTNSNGAFRLEVPSTATTLEISYVGYATQRVSIPASGQVSVTLTQARQTTTLDEVVVTGYTTIQ